MNDGKVKDPPRTRFVVNREPWTRFDVENSNGVVLGMHRLPILVFFAHSTSQRI